MKKIVQGIAVLSISALGLVGCGNDSSDNASSSGTDDKVQVVTTTDVYADIVKDIAGDSVEITPLINSTSQDPHSYEATSADRLTVKDADLVVLNGGGYDHFLEDMAGVDNTDQTVINAVKTSGKISDEEYAELTEEHSESEEEHDHGSFNEHVWYDLDSMKKLANEIAEDLGEQLPENAEQYTEAADEFATKIDELKTQAEEIDATGKNYLATEPVAGYLIQTAGFTDKTPEDLTEAVENESDLAPLALQEIKDSLGNGSIDFFAYNEQTSTNQTEEIRQAAQDAGVATASFTETLPEGKNYLDWMSENITNIKKAVA